MEDKTPFANHHNNYHHLSIFPPINHEDLPILPQSPRAPHVPPHSNNHHHHHHPPLPPKHNHLTTTNKITKWVQFALHFWDTKLKSFNTQFPSFGVFMSFPYLGFIGGFMGFVWYWFRLRRRWKNVNGGREAESRLEHFKSLNKSKDEIIQLLEQIAHMNKELLARYKIPVLKAS